MFSQGSYAGEGRSGVHAPSTEDNPTRPVSGLLGMLLDAAHDQHASRNLQHPQTYTYSMFELQTREAMSTPRHWSSSRASGTSTPTRVSAQHSRAPSLGSDCETSEAAALNSARSLSSSIGQLQRKSAPSAAAGGSSPSPSKAAVSSPISAEGITSSKPSSTAALTGAGSINAPRAARVSGSWSEGYGLKPSASGVMLPKRGSSGSFGSSSWYGSALPGEEGCAAASPYLEVTCEYDAHFQSGDIQGRQGALVRPFGGTRMGPVALLFRWYSKRCTQFTSGAPAPGDLTDAPPMPPAELMQSPGLDSTPRTSNTTGGRCMNCQPDPTMNCEEFIELLEDFDLMPHWVSRLDVGHLFAAASSIKSEPPGKVHKAGVQPAEIRYPQFCDLLVRLALTAAARRALAAETAAVPAAAADPQAAAEAASAAATAARRSYILANDPYAVDADAGSGADASAFASVDLGPDGEQAVAAAAALAAAAVQAAAALRQQVPLPSAAEALDDLMGALELTSPNITILKQRLDSLARMVKDRAGKKTALKWMHVDASTQSGVEAVTQVFGRRGGLRGCGGWSPCQQGVRAPEALQQQLLSYDADAAAVYMPCWTAFKEPALDLGAMQPGEVRCVRVVLRNRSPYKMAVALDAAEVPWLQLAFNEQSLAPGVPRVVDVTARFDALGEYSGEIKISTRIRQEPEGHVNYVPVYCLVGPASGQHKVPASKAQRASLAAKAVAARQGLPSGSGTSRRSGPGSSSFLGSASAVSSLAGSVAPLPPLPFVRTSVAATSSRASVAVSSGGPGAAGSGHGVGAVKSSSAPCSPFRAGVENA